MKAILSSLALVLFFLAPASAQELDVVQNLKRSSENRWPVVERAVSATAPNRAKIQSYIYTRNETGQLTMVLTDDSRFVITSVIGELTVDQILNCFGRLDIDAQEKGLVFIRVGADSRWTTVFFESFSQNPKSTMNQFMCE